MFRYKYVIKTMHNGTLELYSNRSYATRESCRKDMVSCAKETYNYWDKKAEISNSPATYEEKDFENIVVEFSTIRNKSPDRIMITYSIEEFQIY